MELSFQKRRYVIEKVNGACGKDFAGPVPPILSVPSVKSRTFVQDEEIDLVNL